MNTQSIEEDAATDYGYEETVTTTKTTGKKDSVRISALPKDIQADARKLDVDGDGALCTTEVGAALVRTNKTKKDNRSLKNTIGAFGVLTVLLIACIFAATITAARLSKDINVSSSNGFAYVKGSGSKEVMKTSTALIRTEGNEESNVALLSNNQLERLTSIIFMDGDLKFIVKGYSRGDPTSIENNEHVRLLVEGGTITYDKTGVIGSTGSANALLEFAFGPDFHEAGSDGQRRLWSSFNFLELLADMFGSEEPVGEPADESGGLKANWVKGC